MDFKMIKIKLTVLYILLIVIAVNAQWTQLNSSTILDLNSVYFLDKNNGFACGDSGIVLKTNDGGDTWSQNITSGNVNLRSITFSDSLTGIAVGSNSGIFKTSDGGSSWSLKNLNPDINFNDVKFITSTRILVVGDAGAMLLSNDQGNNWQDISDQYQTKWINISFLNENYGWISGSYGFKITTDGGNSWTFQSSNNEGNRVFIYDANLMFRMGWTYLPPPNMEPLMHLEKSTDLGISWLSQNAGHQIGNWRAIFFCTPQIGYLLEDYGYLYTLNQGEEWVESSFPNILSMNAICFADSSTGWAVGNDGTILKTTNGGGVFTDVKQEENNLKIGFILSQNYPNPFNPRTNIQYQIPDNEFVSLKVYDVLGNEVGTLVNAEKPSGIYTVNFDGSKLSSGIYFYKLLVSALQSEEGKAGEFTATRKLILLK
jgi:photosystem II stability/assembly factor-like uncharacterized protein